MLNRIQLSRFYVTKVTMCECPHVSYSCSTVNHMNQGTLSLSAVLSQHHTTTNRDNHFNSN